MLQRCDLDQGRSQFLMSTAYTTVVQIADLSLIYPCWKYIKWTCLLRLELEL